MSKKEESESLININEMLSQTGNVKSTETKDALEAIEMTGKVIDAIMSGKQIDLSFYGFLASKSIKKIKKNKVKK